MSTFTYSEAIETRFQRHIKSEFIINRTVTNKALFIRLLLGTLTVTNIFSTDSFDQFIDYSILGRKNNTIISSSVIRRCLEPDCSLKEICEHIDQTKWINKDFYLNLLEEVSSYFYKVGRGSYTTGFLHLYRTVEFISYSFPLIYASSSHDYYGSFSKLKVFFDSAKSEVVFFDEFVNKIVDISLLDSPLTFNFNTLSIQVNHNHYSIIKRFLKTEEIISEIPDVSLTTKYRFLLRVIIDIRNRYFHFAMGAQRNIRSTEIIENDIFFNIINEELLNWIAVIYFEILKTSVKK